MEDGTDLFNSANCWAGLDGTGKHQMVVNGTANSTVNVDSLAKAGT